VHYCARSITQSVLPLPNGVYRQQPHVFGMLLCRVHASVLHHACRNTQANLSLGICMHRNGAAASADHAGWLCFKLL
jgi:hypothetical protein